MMNAYNNTGMVFFVTISKLLNHYFVQHQFYLQPSHYYTLKKTSKSRQDRGLSFHPSRSSNAPVQFMRIGLYTKAVVKVVPLFQFAVLICIYIMYS